MSAVNLKGVVKRYGPVEVVKGIDLVIESEEFVALVGPSGCGKTTTLRMIAGLEDISGGEIRIGGTVINDVAPKNRDIAMVFQSYALYPHMTVFDNIAFGLRMRSMRSDEIRERIGEVAKMLEIQELLDRKPKNLSGGQRQRVAMGRAIVRKPSVFLFDEPLSNLDAQLRVHMRTELKRLRNSVKTTTVYVTHDQVEAMTLADRIVVMNKGKIEQVGQPSELYSSPRTRFVAAFIGSPAMNFLPCTLTRDSQALMLRLADGQLLPVPEDRFDRYGAYIDRPVVLGIRPEHVGQMPTDRSSGLAKLTVLLDVVEPLGAETLIFCRVGDKVICGKVHASAQLSPGQTIEITAEMYHMHLIDPATDLVV